MPTTPSSSRELQQDLRQADAAAVKGQAAKRLAPKIWIKPTTIATTTISAIATTTATTTIQMQQEQEQQYRQRQQNGSHFSKRKNVRMALWPGGGGPGLIASSSKRDNPVWLDQKIVWFCCITKMVTCIWEGGRSILRIMDYPHFSLRKHLQCNRLVLVCICKEANGICVETGTRHNRMEV